MPPTLYFNVPAGYALLAPALENDAELAERFFSRLRFMFYAAAALPDALAERLRQLAEDHADHEVPLTSSWGTTETAPGATTMHFLAARRAASGSRCRAPRSSSRRWATGSRSGSRARTSPRATSASPS